MGRRVRVLTLLAIIAILVQVPALPARGAEPPEDSSADYYTLVAGDEDPDTLVRHMRVTEGDPFREILLWNPQLHDVYGLAPGLRLRVPGKGPRPAFPVFTTDFSRWVVIADHTSRFTGSPPERVENIVNAANAINNFFNDSAHPYVAPRDSLSLTWLLGDISTRNGYVWGHAIGVVDGQLVDIPAVGGGICQIPSTIFPAVMKAGLDVTVRRNHSYYPYFWWGYPEGFGWDATIVPPYQDFEWRNLYDHPVRLFARVDRKAYTLTIQVWAPPELVRYENAIDGPYLVRAGKLVPAGEAGWVWWAATTVITQRTALDGRIVERKFWSSYRADPHRSALLR